MLVASPATAAMDICVSCDLRVAAWTTKEEQPAAAIASAAIAAAAIAAAAIAAAAVAAAALPAAALPAAPLSAPALSAPAVASPAVAAPAIAASTQPAAAAAAATLATTTPVRRVLLQQLHEGRGGQHRRPSLGDLGRWSLHGRVPFVVQLLGP